MRANNLNYKKIKLVSHSLFLSNMTSPLANGLIQRQKCNDRHFVIKVVIYRNVAFTHSNTQKYITELKQKHAICLGMRF